MPLLPSHPAAAPTGQPPDTEAVRRHLASRALRPGRTGVVGLELERHVVDVAEPLRPVDWRRLTGALTGLQPPAGSSVTLEPGGQVELSTPPASGVAAAVEVLRRDAAVVDAALAEAGLALLSVGADPVRAPVRINPGARYAAMESYFRAVGHGRDGAAMMCSTAALQLNVEAGPAGRLGDRLTHLHRLLPVLIALAGCSPLLGGRDTGMRSARQGVWQRLDPGRCAPWLRDGDPAAAWAEFALAAPVMLVRSERTGAPQPVHAPVPLVDWVRGRHLLDGRCPTLADVDLHLSTLWPPVRLRGWLELRVLDTVPAAWWPGLAAVVATVLDDVAAADRAAEAAEPVAQRHGVAARDGISDPALGRAARGLVAAALPAVPAVLRPDVERWAELLDSGRTPADLVRNLARRTDAAGCLLAEELR
ncbi:glutamate--cysteine ligase [Kineococcus xinjiangensis]|uniref:Glutamate--cysteine ligase EgtA n=1 Tax=Kineococcus xinjiangensis TaxID=512762 RepID=A0A2S6IK48_9ACTN|nr:glutamate-cysteine ligase family protein [Kineococcus xinjiangensis]PPK94556.1 glutamate--cysteine ligase [Kineococcus xinjiangensis]